MKTGETDLARKSLDLFGRTGTLRKISAGLDNSYRVRAADGQVYALRVSSGATIRRVSAFAVEAAWIDALSDNPWFRIPLASRTPEGALIATVPDERNALRASTLLSWIPGRRTTRIGPEQARVVGRMAGALHQDSRDRTAPARGEIKSWDATRMCGMWKKDARHRFGTDAAGIVEEVYKALTLLMAGIDRNECGLINADLGLHNVVFHQGQPGIVDFNDAGVGPYAFCLGRLLERIRLMERGDLLAEALLSGYTEVIPLPSAYVERGGLFELAAAVFKLNFGAARASTHGTILEKREQETICRLRGMLDDLE